MATVSFVLAVSSLWSVDLKAINMREVYAYSLIIAILMGQLGIVLAFWPIKALMGSLVLVAGLYALLGIFQQRLANRIFLGNYIEYVVFSLIVAVTGFLITSWRG